uniref:Uncharacterized protein n=1 Tax=Anopheles maculatus TaxID=74869 RepID=A0A182T126_9DIPT
MSIVLCILIALLSDCILHISYTVTKRYRQGPPERVSCEFVVNGDLMKFCRDHERRNYKEEQKLLWDIFTEYQTNCEVAEITDLLLLPQDKKNSVFERGMKSHIIDRLNSLLPSVNWDEIVHEVHRLQETYMFGVKSILLKREILHMVRGTMAENIITDFDKIDRPVRNTDDSVDGGDRSGEYLDYGSGLGF